MQRENINYIFQHADISDLRGLFEKIKSECTLEVLQPPTSQTLLQPVIDPISKSKFYSGEILVTSAIVQVNGYKGWAMVMDDNEELALIISVLDACFDGKIFLEEMKSIYTKTVQKIEQEKKIFNQKINSTRVSFDLM